MNAKPIAVVAAAFFIAGCVNNQARLIERRNSYLEDQRKSSIEIALITAKIGGIELKRMSEADFIEGAKRAIKYSLKDPESAQFIGLSLRKYAEGTVVCGKYNAKNSYGGYVGFKSFYGNATGSISEKTEREKDVYEAMNAGLIDACKMKSPW